MKVWLNFNGNTRRIESDIGAGEWAGYNHVAFATFNGKTYIHFSEYWHGTDNYPGEMICKLVPQS